MQILRPTAVKFVFLPYA